jgi:hypothetical protein
MAMMQEIRGTAAVDVSPDDRLALMNAVPVTLRQLEAADDASVIRDHDKMAGQRADAVAARLEALRAWQETHDPEGLLDRRHLLDAAAMAKLIEGADTLGFDPEGFGDLVAFVAEIPW